MSAPVIYSIEGTDVKHSLPKLTPANIVEIGEKVHVCARERLIADLDLAGADPELRMKELNELGSRRGLGSVVVRHAFTVAGALAIIECSIARSGKDIDVESLQLDPTRGLFELALKLIGVNWDEMTADTDEDDLRSDPTERSLPTG